MGITDMDTMSTVLVSDVDRRFSRVKECALSGEVDGRSNDWTSPQDNVVNVNSHYIVCIMLLYRIIVKLS